MSLGLRWTEHAVNQLGAIAEHISLVSPVYAEQTVDRIARRFQQAQAFPESGRRVPEAPTLEIREIIEFPYRLIYRVRATPSRSWPASMVTKTCPHTCRAEIAWRPYNER